MPENRYDYTLPFLRYRQSSIVFICKICLLSTIFLQYFLRLLRYGLYFYKLERSIRSEYMKAWYERFSIFTIVFKIGTLSTNLEKRRCRPLGYYRSSACALYLYFQYGSYSMKLDLQGTCCIDRWESGSKSSFMDWTQQLQITPNRSSDKQISENKEWVFRNEQIWKL